MKLFIPDIGDELCLSKAWSFNTICEYRNEKLFDAFEVDPEYRWNKPVPGYRIYSNDGYDHYSPKQEGFDFVLPKNTVLKVDRVYIRKGMEDFSSLTFFITASPDPRLVTKKLGGTAPKTIRFWAKLAEVRNMDVSL